ncbi:MAG: ABC transporter permease subunit [Candidatus Hydrogenedens sp.]|nr:ABC transporter permease subunit [Candidatus Hydrogenedentota bacterium]NLF56316.1 ABC transporter permease subunit [Candidatus Hydrogenedens sp.]
MTRRVFLAWLAELLRAMRLWQTWAGPLMAGAAVGLTLPLRPVVRDGRSDYDFIAQASPMALGLVGFVMLLVWCAGLLAPETGSGAVRFYLVRPILRREYVLAKFLAGAAYAVLLLAVVGGASWGVAFALGDLQGVAYGGELVHTREAMFGAWLLGGLLSLLPLWAGASLALLASACTRSTATAAMVTLGVWLLLDLVKHPLGVDAWVFTTYLEAPWQVFVNRCDGLDASWSPMAWRCAAASLGVTLPSVGGAMLVLGRRDLTA